MVHSNIANNQSKLISSYIQLALSTYKLKKTNYNCV